MTTKYRKNILNTLVSEEMQLSHSEIQWHTNKIDKNLKSVNNKALRARKHNLNGIELYLAHSSPDTVSKNP